MRPEPLALFRDLAEWRSFSPGLSRINDVLRQMGTPHCAYPHLVVGGTNGKGTVATSIARAIKGRVGLFLSPHIHDIRERISINGEWLADEKWDAAHAKILKKTGPLHLSYFEWLLVLAVQLFSDEEVDYAVFEIGLGGRLDAVNTLEPTICVLTNVSLDHMEILGSNRTAIALDKIEIARPGKPMLVPADIYAIPEVQKRLKEIGCRVFAFAAEKGFLGNLVVVQSVFDEMGIHQRATLAGLPCRREILDGRIFLDGAHNEEAWLDLVAWLKSKGKMNVLCSLSNGRDPRLFTRILAPVATVFHVWQAGYEKERPFEDWPHGVTQVEEKHLKSLIKQPLLVCGSLYLTGLFRTWYSASKAAKLGF